MTTYQDPRTGRPVGDVPSSVEGSTGAGEDRFGDRPQSLAEAAGAAADAKASADAKGLLAAGERQAADTKRRQV